MLDFHFNQPYGNSDSFIGYYINSFNDMDRLAVPFGNTIVGVNLDSGFLWSKKLDLNGIPVIRTFKLEEVRIENENEKLQKEIEYLKKEIEMLKGGNLDATKPIDEPTHESVEESKPTTL